MMVGGRMLSDRERRALFARGRLKIDPMTVGDDVKELKMSDKIAEALVDVPALKQEIVYRRPEVVIERSGGRDTHLYTSRMEGRSDLVYMPDGDGFGVRFSYEFQK